MWLKMRGPPRCCGGFHRASHRHGAIMNEVLIAIFGGTGAIIIRELFAWLLRRNSDAAKENRQSERDKRNGYKDLIDRLEKKIDWLEKREDRCREELTIIGRRFERAFAWIAHLENALEGADIPYKKYVDIGTGESPPLPPGAKR